MTGARAFWHIRLLRQRVPAPVGLARPGRPVDRGGTEQPKPARDCRAGLHLPPGMPTAGRRKHPEYKGFMKLARVVLRVVYPKQSRIRGGAASWSPRLRLPENPLSKPVPPGYSKRPANPPGFAGLLVFPAWFSGLAFRRSARRSGPARKNAAPAQAAGLTSACVISCCSSPASNISIMMSLPPTNSPLT